MLIHWPRRGKKLPRRREKKKKVQMNLNLSETGLNYFSDMCEFHTSVKSVKKQQQQPRRCRWQNGVKKLQICSTLQTVFISLLCLLSKQIIIMPVWPVCMSLSIVGVEWKAVTEMRLTTCLFRVLLTTFAPLFTMSHEIKDVSKFTKD